MPQCEMCGKRGKLTEAIVEGTILSVCDTCIEYGNAVIVERPTAETRKRVQREIEGEVEKEIEVIIPEAGEIIKKERERKKLKQEELAKMLAEKSSTISAAESGRANIPIQLARKFEQFFSIKLITKGTQVETPQKKVNMKDPDLTIGDLIRYKGRKKG